MDDDLTDDMFPELEEGHLSEHFTEEEFECKCGCKIVNVSEELLDLLEGIRHAANTEFDPGQSVRTITIHSGCRCPKHNGSDEVGGSATSNHITTSTHPCTAADITISGLTPMEVFYLYLKVRRFTPLGLIGGFKMYPNKNMCHVDVRNDRFWAVDMGVANA